MSIATTILEAIGKKLWGFKPNLMKDIVEQRGGASSVIWVVKNLPKFEKILKEWGPVRTHLLVSTISGINGCPYCTYGHGYAAQLHYFKQTGQLFPIDEHEMMNFNSKEEKEIVTCLKDAYEKTNLKTELADLDRMLELKSNPALTSTKDDKYILQLINLFELLNSCAIKSNTKEDAAHDPINKDTALIKRYTSARGK